LTDCLNHPFVFALNPNQILSKVVVCPKLGEVDLHIETGDRFCIDELLEMTKEWSSREVKLSTIIIICSQELVPANEMDKLRDHVSRVEYRLDGVIPSWYEASGDLEEADYETDTDWC
jgi:hypothetical protein